MAEAGDFVGQLIEAAVELTSTHIAGMLYKPERINEFFANTEMREEVYEKLVRFLQGVNNKEERECLNRFCLDKTQSVGKYYVFIIIVGDDTKTYVIHENLRPTFEIAARAERTEHYQERTETRRMWGEDLDDMEYILNYGITDALTVTWTEEDEIVPNVDPDNLFWFDEDDEEE